MAARKENFVSKAYLSISRVDMTFPGPNGGNHLAEDRGEQGLVKVTVEEHPLQRLRRIEQDQPTVADRVERGSGAPLH